MVGKTWENWENDSFLQLGLIKWLSNMDPSVCVHAMTLKDPKGL